MNALVRMLAAGALIGAAACGGSDVPDPDTAAEVRADSTPAGDLMAPAGDSTRPPPPGLAPVAVDDADRHTADQPTTNGPSGQPRQPAAPAGGQQQAPAPATPQEPAADEGAAVLRRAAAAYEDVTSMQASFVMHFNNPLLRQQTTSRGMLYQQRPDRIALRFTDPDGDIILSDGQNFFIYQPSIDARQATQTPAAPGGGGGVDLQAQFVGNPTERFRYTLEGRENVGNRPADVMILVPRARAEYRSLKVWFDTRDSLARRFEITEHNGSVRRFDLSGLRTNTAVPEDVFRFIPPAGVRIVRVG
ncbi:MAG TPA: outer-membrane lipoprotein carrier protein LolA [Longimicrobiales bacterium]|nr:outer-membrane lipoprotein carrier protein LolA [Longimicrobiales bacterium]